jgi:hypothetical protein
MVFCPHGASQAEAGRGAVGVARRFVTGNLFAFNCFDGSRGAGRIYGDGSVIGTIQFQGSGPIDLVWLTASASDVLTLPDRLPPP